MCSMGKTDGAKAKVAETRDAKVVRKCRQPYYHYDARFVAENGKKMLFQRSLKILGTVYMKVLSETIKEPTTE